MEQEEEDIVFHATYTHKMDVFLLRCLLAFKQGGHMLRIISSYPSTFFFHKLLKFNQTILEKSKYLIYESVHTMLTI